MYQDLQVNRLRALITIHEYGGFRRAADELHITQPAVSQQIRQLTRFIKAPVFTSTGRDLQLSPEGEELLGYARRIVALNDELVARFAPPPDGRVRITIGIGDQLAEALPEILRHLTTAIPHARICIRTGHSESLEDELSAGQLDLALLLQPGPPRDHGPSHEIGRLHLDWFGQPHDTDGAVPLTLFTEPCAFRGHVITALDASQVPWRVGYEGAELVGLRAAAKAGLGVTSLIANSDQLWDLPRTTGVDLPPPPDPVPVSLAVAAKGGKARRRLANLTTEAAHDALADYPFAA